MGLGGSDEPQYAPFWEDSWDLALEELGQDAQSIDRQLENVYWRLERYPLRYSYPARKTGSNTRITFAKRRPGERLRVWYRVEGQEVLYLWVDIAPYDEGQDDPYPYHVEDEDEDEAA